MESRIFYRDGKRDRTLGNDDMPLTEQTLLNQIAVGEDSGRLFKRDTHNAESLAAEMAAFANSEGGVIYLGVNDAGQAVGLAQADVVRLNQLIGYAASQLVRSPLAVRTENVLLANGRVVIALTVPKGLDKPYFDKNGVIWLKAGAVKRRVNSKEELRRLFQISGQLFTAIVHRKAAGESGASAVSPLPQPELAGKKAVMAVMEGMAGNESEVAGKTAVKVAGKILVALREDDTLTALALAERFGMSLRSVERVLATLRKESLIRRRGPTRGGKWEVVEE